MQTDAGFGSYPVIEEHDKDLRSARYRVPPAAGFFVPLADILKTEPDA